MSVMLIFIAFAAATMIIKADAPSEFSTACNETTGMVPEIDALYSKGQDIMCTAQCPCAAGN